MSRNPVYIGITQRILELAARPEGASPADLVPEFTQFQFSNNANWMIASKLVIAVGVRHLRKLFIHQCDADHYRDVTLADHKKRMCERKKELRSQRARAKRAEASKSRPPKSETVKRQKVAAKKVANRPRVIRKQSAGEPGVTIKHYGRGVHRDAPAVIPPGVKVQKCPSPPAFGPAARLLNVSRAQMENRLPPLRLGDDR